jgi:hypothetical protein
MPLLQSLTVLSEGVTSLSFLAATPQLHATLTCLWLRYCDLPPSQVQCLQGLRALEFLELFQCFTTPLDAAILTTLTPGAEGFMVGPTPQKRGRPGFVSEWRGRERSRQQQASSRGSTARSGRGHSSNSSSSYTGSPAGFGIN